ncbi:MobA/MobL family protein [Faecalibacterium gallinarum]|uniref:Tyr recombinase domain-containing protein n=1 Tax=Faecalibacterium gallinarum TaxID=2903556 RepID=A0AA37IW87_9FIRM|nr:MobA/MobL family protein [Faecalibacterium gallinarum]GJN63424.1 hypothetical protein JCM17207_00490 [Faecalibacterium gallinarum]
MPNPHFDITITQRSKGQSAVAGAAYQSGEKLFSEYDQKTKNYSGKRGILYTEIMLPSHAPPEYANRETLWNSVEAAEKQWNAQLARRFVLALPKEVPPEQYPQMVRDYCEKQFVSKGMIADFAIHDPDPPGHNVHCHVMLTLRAMDEHEQAVRWELIAKNPFDNVILPKSEYKKRDIWDAGMIRTALDQCTDSKLYVAMNLSFACSLRMGEILGLTWSNVHISDEEIAADNAYVYIDKELTRASKRAIEMLGQKDIYHVFTPLFPNTSTRVILKKPKTDSSIRKVWLPKTLAYILREWKASQDELRGFLGDEYQDYDLVVALPNGRPCEDRIILKSFEKLREKAGLPKVVFHSLRHSSTTYKLKLNHGDLKATQGDTGHAEIDMITSVYSHILDEDRKINAQKFESAFYANPDLRSVRPPEEEKEPAPTALDLEALVEQLRKSPELANTLAALLSATPGSK